MSGSVEQIAALPVRWDRKGRMEVLMVTSREKGRWVMPKGWKMSGKSPWAAARIEALEEAGATGCISKTPIGVYSYTKTLDSGKTVTCRVRLYPMVVGKLKTRWKERRERKRRWFSPDDAARRVKERELAWLLGEVDRGNRARRVLKRLRKAA